MYMSLKISHSVLLLCKFDICYFFCLKSLYPILLHKEISSGITFSKKSSLTFSESESLSPWHELYLIYTHIQYTVLHYLFTGYPFLPDFSFSVLASYLLRPCITVKTLYLVGYVNWAIRTNTDITQLKQFWWRTINPSSTPYYLCPKEDCHHLCLAFCIPS